MTENENMASWISIRIEHKERLEFVDTEYIINNIEDEFIKRIEDELKNLRKQFDKIFINCNMINQQWPKLKSRVKPND